MKLIPRLGLRGAITLWSALVVLLALVAASELALRMLQAHLNGATHTQLTTAVGSALNLTEQSIARQMANAELAATQDNLEAAFKQGDAGEMLRILVPLRNALDKPGGRVGAISLVDTSGHAVASTDPINAAQVSALWPVRQALSDRPVAGLVDRSNLPPLIAAAVPVHDEVGHLLGVVVVIDPLDDRFFNEVAAAIGADAGLIAHGRLTGASSGLRRPYSVTQKLDPALVADRPPAYATVALGDVQFHAALRQVPRNAAKPIGMLVVAAPTSAVEATLASTRLQFMAVGLAVVLLAGIAACVMATTLTRPLHRLAEATRSLADGNLEARADVRGPAEVAAVASAVNQVATALGTTLARLRQEKSAMEATVNSMSDGVVVTDSRGQVTLINPAAQRLLGLDTSVVTPSQLRNLLPQGNGHARTIENRSAQMVDDLGVVLGTVTLLHDATHEHEVERLKSEFISSLSHELQTPLTSIKGAAELVLDGETGEINPVQHRFLHTIRRNCDRLIALVSDLLDLSRLEAGRIQLQRQRVDTGHLLQDLVASLNHLFSRKQQVVEVEFATQMAPLFVDRHRAEQIVTNLLTNASKYTPPGGRIHVAAAENGTMISISVSDSGPGIPAAEQAHLFEKFYRGGDALTRGESGSGLGLAITKSLVELHGGTIEVRSELGQGSCFTVSLPKSTDEIE